MRRMVLAAVAAATAFVGLSLTTASAANLTLTAASDIFVVQESQCAPGVIDGAAVIETASAGSHSAGVYTRVSVGDIPDNCEGLPLEVLVHSAAGDLIAFGAGATGTGTAEVIVGSYTAAAVTAVVVRIDGWLFPTTWIAPAPSNPAVPLGPITCYKVDSSGNVVLDGAGEGVLCDNAPTISVNTWTSGETNHTMQAQFSVLAVEPSVLLVLDFSDPVFDAYQGDPEHSWVSHVRYGAVSDVAPDYSCSELPVFEIKGTHPNVGWGAHSISGAVILNSQPADGAICSPY